jgi:hypothetical protein
MTLPFMNGGAFTLLKRSREKRKAELVLASQRQSNSSQRRRGHLRFC